MDVIQIPAVLIITGTQSSAQTKISIGIPFFASAREALILFKDVTTGRLTVIYAGSFAPLKRETTLDLTSWTSLLVYANEKAFNKRCSDLAINITRSEGRQLTRAVSLGPDWDAATNNALVDVPTLLAERQIRLEDSRNLLEEEAIDQLALICKTSGQLLILRDLILGHKQQEILIRLEDRYRAGKIMEKLQSAKIKPEEKEQLIEELRQSRDLH